MEVIWFWWHSAWRKFHHSSNEFGGFSLYSFLFLREKKKMCSSELEVNERWTLTFYNLYDQRSKNRYVPVCENTTNTPNDINRIGGMIFFALHVRSADRARKFFLFLPSATSTKENLKIISLDLMSSITFFNYLNDFVPVGKSEWNKNGKNKIRELTIG